MAVSFMLERCSFIVFLTVPLIFAKYQKIMLLVALVTFLGIYSLYLYNFFRHFLESDCEKLEATTDGVEKVYLSSNGQKIAFISHLYRRLWNEQSKRKEVEYAFEWNLKLEKEIMKDEKRKLMEKFKGETLVLVERLRVLEEKCAKLVEKNLGLADELNGEKQKVSGLEVTSATLVKEKDKLGKELEDVKQWFRVASELLEMLKGKLLEMTNMNEQVKKVEEKKKRLAKKMRKIEKMFNKLEEEKKDWVAERENLLVVVDSQASLVQTYRDFLDKEECLMKLFAVSNSTSGRA